MLLLAGQESAVADAVDEDDEDVVVEVTRVELAEIELTELEPVVVELPLCAVVGLLAGLLLNDELPLVVEDVLELTDETVGAPGGGDARLVGVLSRSMPNGAPKYSS